MSEEEMYITVQTPEGDTQFDLEPKTFSTGSEGYYASGKLEMNGKRFQCNFQLVELKKKKQEE